MLKKITINCQVVEYEKKVFFYKFDHRFCETLFLGRDIWRPIKPPFPRHLVLPFPPTSYHTPYTTSSRSSSSSVLHPHREDSNCNIPLIRKTKTHRKKEIRKNQPKSKTKRKTSLLCCNFSHHTHRRKCCHLIVRLFRAGERIRGSILIVLSPQWVCEGVCVCG